MLPVVSTSSSSATRLGHCAPAVDAEGLRKIARALCRVEAGLGRGGPLPLQEPRLHTQAQSWRHMARDFRVTG